MTPTLKTILIIDDHRLFADGLSLMLTQLDASLSVSTAYNARVLLENMAELRSYDLVLIDLDMPSINGFDFLTAVSHRQVKIDVLVISGSEKITDVERTLRLGAKGFIQKNMPSTEMLDAIKRVLNGECYLPRHLSESVDWSACRAETVSASVPLNNVSSLRPRQLEVLGLMQDGHSNAKIGTILGISESAVKSHVSKLFKALNTRNRTATIKAGTELGLIKNV